MKTFVRVAMGLAALAVAQAGVAQTYPAKPVRVVIPFPPGGAADTLLRPLAPKLAELAGQQFVVDARQGANGNIVAESGMPGYESTTWYGFLGPAGLPKDIYTSVCSAISRASSTSIPG
jgi:tripartite-type tricarboxylate transporter receptor subunit TctC